MTQPQFGFIARVRNRLHAWRAHLEDGAGGLHLSLPHGLTDNHVRPDLGAARAWIARHTARFRPWEFVTAPVIFALIVPFAFLDLCVTIYQAICFPIYGLPKVKRGDYIHLDRHKLGYLNLMQKLNCVYCGYCNGLLAYVAEVAGRTEHYFCPIKHGHDPKASHRHYAQFLPYDDDARHREEIWDLKARARACDGCEGCGAARSELRSDASGGDI